MKACLIFALSCLISFAARAKDGEHLIPEASLFSEYDAGEQQDAFPDYYANVLQLFDAAYQPDVFARAIVYPSFQTEYAVALKRNGDTFTLIYLAPSVKISLFESLRDYKAGRITIVGDDDGAQIAEDIRQLEELLPPSIDDVRVDICEQEIPASLGEMLYFLWGDMLIRTRYPDERPLSLDGDDTIIIGTDGVTYHFSFEYNYQRLAGKIWSPDSDSLAGKFVSITQQLVNACGATDKKPFIKLEKMVSDLSLDLSKSSY